MLFRSAQPAAAATAQNSPAPLGGRPRAPSSRHFSTSLSASSGDEKVLTKEKGAATALANGTIVVHPLRNTYVRNNTTRPERVLTLTLFLSHSHLHLYSRSGVLQMGVLVPPAARAGEQNHEL